MHETNVALCLASGFLAPRLEENAARDHHLAAGRLVLEQHAPTADSIQRARGDLPYGVVVVAELRADGLPAGPGEAEAVPLAAARRLVFEDERSRLEFAARTSAYADIPRDVLPCEVDPSLFAAQAVLPGEARAEAPAAAQMDGLSARLLLLDRCAGALAAAFSTLGAPAGLAAALGGLGEGSACLSSGPQLAWQLVARIDDKAAAEAYGPLLASLARLLCEASPSDGFSAASMLRSIDAALGDDGGDGGGAEATRRFVAFARDVVALRRDLPNAAFADMPGSAIPRGALLFLLNPEPETLAAVHVRTPGLGPRVYFVAAMLVGFRAGMSRLPASLKSGPAFYAIPSFVLSATHGQVQPMTVASHWERSGARVDALGWGGVELACERLEPSAEHGALVDAAAGAGIRLGCSPGDGTLVAQVSRDGQSAQLKLLRATLRTFPSAQAIEARLCLPCLLPKRNAAAAMASANEQARETGVHCSIVEHGRARLTQLSAFLVAPVAAEALAEAHEALWVQAARWISVPVGPGTADVAGTLP